MSFVSYECVLSNISEKDKNYNSFITKLFNILDECSNTPLCLESILKTKSIEGTVDYPITNINLNAIAEICKWYGKKLWLNGFYLSDDNDAVNILVYIDNNNNISIKEHWNAEEGEY